MVGHSIWSSLVFNADLKGVNGEEPAFGHVAYCEYSSLVLIQVLPPFTPLQMGMSVFCAGSGLRVVASRLNDSVSLFAMYGLTL